ncbi:hypothetical protein NDN08_005802 [Rhodosorus marinus]|uniref:N-acetyltransferase domain-containing protein n=1 Tax=Rhodosorus marinus TaxID=101924 RepID=A0AAV8V4C7_9RHOD|nr:hypothetical protein NDN08_005802 [Rhodosorus marinus]
MPMGQRDFVVAEDLVPEVVGVGCLRQVLDEGSITYLAVSEGSRRRGIGSIVVADLLARCSARGIKRVTLEVAEENSSAISLYKNHRFEIIGRRKNYYAGNVDALVMSLQIESPCEIDSESTAC